MSTATGEVSAKQKALFFSLFPALGCQAHHVLQDRINRRSVIRAVTQRHVKDAYLVSDEAIRHAQRWLWAEFRLAVEPAAALGLAALQTGVYQPLADEKVCLILCGANMDVTALA